MCLSWILGWCPGETRDTAELGLIGAFLSDSLVPRNVRVKLFRTWGSGLGMLPIGGPAVWGNSTWAPDDTEEMKENNQTYGYVLVPNMCTALLGPQCMQCLHHWQSPMAECKHHCRESPCKPFYHSKGCVCNAPTADTCQRLLACNIADYQRKLCYHCKACMRCPRA